MDILIMDTVMDILITDMDMDGDILIMDMVGVIHITVMDILIMDMDTTTIILIIQAEEVLLMVMEQMVIDILKQITDILKPTLKEVLIITTPEEVQQILQLEMVLPLQQEIIHNLKITPQEEPAQIPIQIALGIKTTPLLLQEVIAAQVTTTDQDRQAEALMVADHMEVVAEAEEDLPEAEVEEDKYFSFCKI